MAVTISVDDVVVGEDAGFVDFIIRLNEVSATAVTVNWETNSQTASINDYSSLSGSLTFAPGVRALT
ncbi:Calx-beta domain-containing protein, partial [Asticcacaulis biprosthecium]|uniref:Calx-beta domain-containing protein n=1 Tax=Asticcacaulis biprosthecium TaxID=76891 RepID=UPI0005910FD9